MKITALKTSVICLFPLLVVLPGGVSGARALSGGAAKEVLELEAQAKKSIIQGDFGRAIRKYKDAYAITKNKKYLYNISLLYLKGLEDAVSAWKFARRYQESCRGNAEAGEAKELVERVERRLMDSHGKISLIVTPPDSVIRVDGKPVEEKSPDNVLWLSEGEHVFLAKAQGYEPGSIRVTVVKGESKQVYLHLKALDAVLSVHGNVRGATVFLNGGKIGTVPVQKSLAPGSYRIVVEAEGRRPLKELIILKPGERRRYFADLKVIESKASVPTHEAVKSAPAAIDRKWAWISLGTGGAVSVAGVVLAVLGYLDASAAKDLNPLSFDRYSAYSDAFDSKIGSAKTKFYTGCGLVGLGVAAVGTGVALYFLSGDDSDASIVWTGPEGPGVTARVLW